MSSTGAARVTLGTLVGAFPTGCTAEEIATKSPALDLINSIQAMYA